LSKLVTEKDVGRIFEKYLEITEKLRADLIATDDLDEQRALLFDAVVEGFDVSFALTYDWVVTDLVNKVIGKEKIEVQEELVEPIKRKPPKKVIWGKAGYRRTPSIRYSPRELIMMENMIELGRKNQRIWELFNKSYDKRTRKGVITKLGRLRRT
jgi:hypothetical protein